jgi:hypothetical protein
MKTQLFQKRSKGIVTFSTMIYLFFVSTANAQNTFPSSGNVGIGTLSPGYPLTVNSANYWSAVFQNNGSSTDKTVLVDLKSGDGTLWRYGVGGTGNGIGLTSGQYYIEKSGLGAVFVINSSGYAGLGTTTPSYPLHISSSSIRGLQIDGSNSNWAGMYVNATNATGQPFYGYTTQSGKASWHYLTPGGDWRLYLGGDRLTVLANGNFLVGKTSQVNSIYKLDVNGSARANEIVVNTTGADFVFEENYALPSLTETEEYVKTNKHLPGVPSAEEMQKEGMKVGELQTTLLQKVEELTLYVIELKKENEALKAEMQKLKKKK